MENLFFSFFTLKRSKKFSLFDLNIFSLFIKIDSLNLLNFKDFLSKEERISPIINSAFFG